MNANRAQEEEKIMMSSTISKKEIYVVGASRSGTTMMGRILGKNTAVFTFKELHFFEQICEPTKATELINVEAAHTLLDRLIGVQRVGYFHYHGKHTGQFINEAKDILSNSLLKIEEYTSLNIFLLFLYNEAKLTGKELVCDQSPRNILYCNEISYLCPNAIFVNMVRDPRAILLSQKKKWKRKFLGANEIPFMESVRSFFNYHPITISLLWRAAISKGIDYGNTQKLTMVKFEDLLDHPQATVNKICEFLQLKYEDTMLEIPHMGSSNAEDRQATLGIRKDVADAWKNGGLNAGEIYWCQVLSKKGMDTFGYKKQAFAFPPILAIIYLIWFPISIVFAFCLNIGRAKNILTAIRKRLS